MTFLCHIILTFLCHITLTFLCHIILIFLCNNIDLLVSLFILCTLTMTCSGSKLSDVLEELADYFTLSSNLAGITASMFLP